MSAAGSPGASLNDLSSGAESPQETVREKLVRQHRASKSPAMAAAGGEAAGDTAPLWVALPTMQSLFDSAIPPSSASSSMSMISWLKFWSEHSRCIPALSALSKTDFITIFLDVKRGAVGADAHELSLSDFCSCLIAVADRLNLISIPSSPGRSAASCAPSAEVLSAMSSFTASLQQSHHTPQHSRAATSGPVSAVVSSPPIASVHSSHDADVAGGSSSALGTAALISGSPDVSSQVLQLLHRFYEFYCSGAARLNHDNYVQCLVELQALQVGNAASGDATQVFFKFAATPDRGMTQEQFVDSIVHLAHVSAPESPLHSSMHALVMLGMGGHFARSQERRNLREVLDSATIGELLKETQSFCAVAFRTCSGGKSILNIAQVNRWLLALKLQPMPSQTDIIHVFRDVLRQQAARGSSSVGLDSLGFQSFLLQLAVLALQGSQVTPTSAGSSFSTLLKHMGWGTSHAPIAAQSSIASPVPAQTIFAVPPVQADGPAASHSDASFSAIHVPSVTRPRSPSIPAGIAVSLFKAAPGNPAASVGNDVLTQLADMEQASAFAELQRIYTDKQVLAVQRKKELQLELEAWTAAELEGAELKYKEQAVFRPTPALQDRERALQVLLSNAIKTHPDELRRQQQIVEAFTSKERQAWRLRCDVYANTVRSRVKMAVDVKKKRLAETLRSMQIQLEVNMKKDFEALSKRFAGKSIFLRSSGPAPPVSDKVMLEHHAPSHQSAATTPRVILTAGAKTSAAARSQSAPRNKQVYSSQLPRDLDSQERQQSQGSGIVRERPQSAIPTMSRRKSVLQEMEEAYLKAASRFDSVYLCHDCMHDRLHTNILTFHTVASGPSPAKPLFLQKLAVVRRSPLLLAIPGSVQHRRCLTRLTAGVKARLHCGGPAPATLQMVVPTWST